MSFRAKYSLAGVDWQSRGRLDVLARELDPYTVLQLEAVGVSAGWRCAEVGAGTGTIAGWLVERVGNIGHVVATDLETRWLEALNLPHLDIRRHDITDQPLNGQQYDLVHARAVLTHVGGWRQALDHMASALRPGGWLVIEEFDLATGAGLSYPSCGPLERFWAAVGELIRRAGGDPYVGRKLVSAFTELGLENIDGSAWMVLGGFRGDLGAVAEARVPTAVEAGLISATEAHAVAAYLADSKNCSYAPLMLSIRGQKPAADGSRLPSLTQ